jgi:hypothetical protein
MGLAGGLNTYAYVGSNPVNFVDPLGLLHPLIIGVVIGGGLSEMVSVAKFRRVHMYKI